MKRSIAKLNRERRRKIVQDRYLIQTDKRFQGMVSLVVKNTRSGEISFINERPYYPFDYKNSGNLTIESIYPEEYKVHMTPCEWMNGYIFYIYK